jgi:hypothetical protein
LKIAKDIFVGDIDGDVIHLLLPGIEYLPDSLSYVLTSPRHQIFVRLCLTPYGTRPPVYLYPV